MALASMPQVTCTDFSIWTSNCRTRDNCGIIPKIHSFAEHPLETKTPMENPNWLATFALSASAFAGPVIAAAIGFWGMKNVQKHQQYHDVQTRQHDIMMRLFTNGFLCANGETFQGADTGLAINEAYIAFKDNQEVIDALEQFRKDVKSGLDNDTPPEAHLGPVIEAMKGSIGFQLDQGKGMFDFSVQTRH